MTTCKVCKTDFVKKKPMQSVCGFECAMVHGHNKAKVIKASAERKDRAVTKVKLDALKPKSHYAKQAQAAVNAFIRARDAGNPCISCGRHHQGAWHAGHYRSTGAAPELRFEELNIHLQCAPCNTHLSGNIVNYRPRLIEKIGIEQVEWVEGKHDAKKYTKEELKAITKDYKAKEKALQI